MLIGISGKMGTDKTTLANHLAKQLKGRRVSFADELRREVEEQFGIPDHYLRDARMKSVMVLPMGHKYFKLRELLQWWGTVRREVDPDYWVKKLLNRVRDSGVPTIVDDVRYTNEADAIMRANGLLIRLDPYPGWESGPGAEHPSEVELDKFDFFEFRFRPKFGGLFPLAYQIKKSL